MNIMTHEELKRMRKISRERDLARRKVVAKPRANVWGGLPDAQLERRTIRRILRGVA